MEEDSMDSNMEDRHNHNTIKVHRSSSMVPRKLRRLRRGEWAMEVWLWLLVLGWQEAHY